MVPATVLWSGGQVDFAEMMELLPGDILTVVQSLFTIAIVLFCAYEMKDIISFAFTLRSSRKEG